MGKKMIKKHVTVLATYPIAVFVFFAILLGISLFVHSYVVDPSHLIFRDIDQKELNENKNEQLQAILSKENDLLTQPIFQPVKKESFADLFVENAHAGIILDVDSGTILWEKRSTEKRSIASITKLVTAMVVVDRLQDLDEVVTIPEEVISIEGTTVGCATSVLCDGERFYPGEKVRVRDLLKAVLIASANDAATVLGIHIAGTEENFARLMNARMKEIGAGNTHFCRPSGLEFDENEEACYSSAYDIARAIAHLKKHEKYDVLWEIMRTDKAVFTNVEGTVEHEVKNTNRLIGKIENLIGAKTGFTPRAGYCLALTAHDPSQKHVIVSVVLDDHQRFIDVENMTTWAFENYMWQ
jgi:serine-type D-Ala-D-Ala carboxypeptidase (penicillin-binding protein 5/6)